MESIFVAGGRVSEVEWGGAVGIAELRIFRVVYCRMSRLYPYHYVGPSTENLILYRQEQLI